ncbi:ABC transporter permease [Halosegnis sp.]|uniref:ABC transporter permease n=1 Tax=Halosegnis sp. TaxID=2864959 RepID=UPI0035D3E278
MSGPLRIARRELSSLSAEKTILLALLVQLFVAAFSSFLVVGLTALYDPSATQGGRVEIAVAGNASEAVVAAGDQAAVTPYDDRAAALAAFDDSRADAVVIAQSVPTGNGSRIVVDATAPESSLRKTLVVVRTRALLEALEREERVRRADSLDQSLAPRPPDVGASPYFSFSYTVLVPLLVLLPAFIAGSTAVDSITEEIERGTLELLRVTPLSLGEVVAGKGAAMAVLVPVQVTLWLGLLALNDIAVANVAGLLVYAAAVAVLLVTAGVALGLLVPNRERAQLLYSLGALAVFTLAGFLPEHPATTIARLAIDSPAAATYGLVAVSVAAAGLAVAGLARLVASLDPESL